MTPRPPTVDHLPISGVQKTIGPKMLVSDINFAILAAEFYTFEPA